MNTYSMCFSGLLRVLVMLGLLFFAVSYIPVANAREGCGPGLKSVNGECVRNHTAAKAAVINNNKNCRNVNGHRHCR